MTIAVQIRERSHARARWHRQSRGGVVLEAAFSIAVHCRHATELNAWITARGHQIEVPIAVDVPKSERIVVVAGLQLHDRCVRESTPADTEKDFDGVPPTISDDDVQIRILVDVHELEA